jgi:DNA polymerase-3 subunit alpha
LRQEKEAAGLYFSGHMLDGYSAALDDPQVMSIRTLCEVDAAGEPVMSDRTRVTVGGIVTAMSAKMTKKDEKMAFFTLEDRFGEIECVVFPAVLSRVSHHLRADAVLCVQGNLSLREEEQPKILVSDLEPLPENGAAPEKTVVKAQNTKKHTEASVAVNKARILYLRVPSMTDPKWLRARNLLDIFAGSLPVSVYDASQKTYQKLTTGFDCTARTLRELQDLLGTDNVVLK